MNKQTEFENERSYEAVYLQAYDALLRGAFQAALARDIQLHPGTWDSPVNIGSSYLYNRVSSNIAENAPESLNALLALREKADASPQPACLSLFGLGGFGRFVFMAAVLCAMDASILPYIRYFEGQAADSFCLDTLAYLYDPALTGAYARDALITEDMPMLRLLFCLQESYAPNTPLGCQPRLRDYYLFRPYAYERWLRPFYYDAPQGGKAQATPPEALLDWFSQPTESGRSDFCINGDPEEGEALVEALCVSSEVYGFFVDLDALFSAPEWAEERLLFVNRECMLTEALVCFHAQDGYPPALWKDFFRLSRQCPYLFRCIFLFPHEKQTPAALTAVKKLRITRLSCDERLTLWQEAYARCCGEPLPDFTAIAGKYRVTQQDIDRIFNTVLQGKNDVTLGDLEEKCQEYISDQIYTVASYVPASFEWEDLILPQEQLNALKEICWRLDYEHKVYHAWNMREKFPYGRGCTALFYGPPGTGKTMAAQVLSREIGLKLFKVDTSSVVDKYIGETEKNIGRIFDAAEKSNLILFFDEADALFGKRVAQADAQDRSANMETSYLLQRIENYEGITILASNILANIDPAFFRRFQFCISFPLPSTEDRKRLWQALLTQSIPKEDIDVNLLAEQFELSGAEIKSSLLAAAFMAAAEGRSLGMLHILKAINNEYDKKFQHFPRGLLSQYGAS